MTESQKAFEAKYPALDFAKTAIDTYATEFTESCFCVWQSGIAYGRKQALEDALAIVQNENTVGDMEFEIKELIK